MKIVFLDFDGVIATKTSYANAKLKPQGLGIDPLDLLVPELVDNVNELCTRAGADVVISSSWRNLYHLDQLRDWLKRAGLQANVIGATPNLFWTDLPSTRGLEIKVWATNNKLGRKDLVILEDEEDVRPYRGRQVQTCFQGVHQGFTKRHLKRALRLWGLSDGNVHGDSISSETQPQGTGAGEDAL